MTGEKISRVRGKHHHPHIHDHGPGCGHEAIEHEGHVDFVHDGHLHRKEGRDWVECAIDENEDRPQGCTREFECAAHADGSICGPTCGHQAVPHGDHMDYLVPPEDKSRKSEYELHCPHDNHCDYHGTVKKVVFQPPAPGG